MSEEDFIAMLKNHDWYYMYSDDHSVWTRGRKESEAIMAAMRDNPEFGPIYTDYTKANIV